MKPKFRNSLKGMKSMGNKLIYGGLFITLVGMVIAGCEKEAEGTIDNLISEQQVEIDWDNISNVSREDYKRLSKEDKAKFKNIYLTSFTSPISPRNNKALNGGGSCSCEGCCKVTCPSGTKPKCQCKLVYCDCGCEPWGALSLQMSYSVSRRTIPNLPVEYKIKPLENRLILTNYLASGFNNANQVASVLKSNEFLNPHQEVVISEKQYRSVENQLQSLVENYTLNQMFAIEYEF